MSTTDSPTAPASPFPPRPAPTSAQDGPLPESPTSATSEAATLVNEQGSNAPLPQATEFVGAFRKVSYPLASFESTPHNVAAIGFLLGCVFILGASSAAKMIGTKSLVWNVASGAERLGQQGLKAALRSPVLGMYIAFWAIFHMLEFIVTSMYNPGKLSVDSYLINNGWAYPIAHLCGMLEHILETAYLPQHYRPFKHAAGLVLVGVGLILGGQILRSFAMISAAANFSHIVAINKLKEHQLVKTGIYAWSRHPSYAGFCWWALGTQVMLANPIGVLAFSVVLYRFFAHRIRVEEVFLVKFFGDEYIKYREEVPTRILFVR